MIEGGTGVSEGTTGLNKFVTWCHRLNKRWSKGVTGVREGVKGVNENATGM